MEHWLYNVQEIVNLYFQVKELGAVVYNCSCLAKDMGKIFDVYWMLGAPNATIPQNWPPNLSTGINDNTSMVIKFNDSQATTYLSVSQLYKGMYIYLSSPSSYFCLFIFWTERVVNHLQSSPPELCPEGRTIDVDAIVNVIDSAEKFVYVAVMDYFPTTQFPKSGEHRR